MDSRLYVLAAACPRCEKQPKIRADGVMLGMARDIAPAQRLHTVQCESCGKIYPLRARDYQQARVA